jgi:hypothetical protein
MMIALTRIGVLINPFMRLSEMDEQLLHRLYLVLGIEG